MCTGFWHTVQFSRSSCAPSEVRSWAGVPARVGFRTLSRGTSPSHPRTGFPSRGCRPLACCPATRTEVLVGRSQSVAYPLAVSTTLLRACSMWPASPCASRRCDPPPTTSETLLFAGWVCNLRLARLRLQGALPLLSHGADARISVCRPAGSCRRAPLWSGRRGDRRGVRRRAGRHDR